MKKLVGVSTELVTAYNKPYIGINTEYVRLIERSGGHPVMIPILEDLDLIDRIVKSLDAVVLAGGADIHPIIYGEDPNPNLGDVCLDRDETELAIITAAIKYGKPILGICRGLQLLNCHFGGTLYQDIFSQVPDVIGHMSPSTNFDFTHSINLDEDGFLYEIMGKDRMLVNSTHHQAIKKLGEGFKVVAKASDGIIEAIENRDKKIFAVQFHPEKMQEKNRTILDILSYVLNFE